MLLETRAVAPFFKNGFVLGCSQTREAVVIDPGDEVDQLLQVVKSQQLHATNILLTHAHVDHVTGVGRAKAALGVPIGLHADDLPLYERAPQQAALFGLRVDPLPPIDFFLEPGTAVGVGRHQLRVHHTPGHCPGGVCLELQQSGEAVPWLFVGDTLFAGSIGRTDLPGGDYATLIRSIRGVLFAFGDQARVFPGHGPETTIGEERRSNPFLQ